ncbi:hypothetical protein V6N13_120786 [Hibiscus sabdariffa]
MFLMLIRFWITTPPIGPWKVSHQPMFIIFHPVFVVENAYLTVHGCPLIFEVGSFPDDREKDCFPGPEIRVQRGDTVFVNVHNQGNSAVSIKWEGVEDSIDGSNDLIQPGRNFTYQIELDDEIGTLWWHATSAWASATVHGAFVVLPAANEDYPFPKPDSDKAIIIGEWFRQELTEANQTIASGQADAYTIDGHPGETTGCSNDTTFEYQVDYQGLYLVRVINAVNETMVFAAGVHHATLRRRGLA